MAVGAVALGAVLVLAAYVHPLFETADAIHTAAGVAADRAAQGVSATQGVADRLGAQARFIRTTDERAINMAKGGLSCLNGKGGCAGSESSPFK